MIRPVIFIAALAVAAPAHAVTLHLNDLLTVDPLGYECILETDLEAAFSAIGKGVLLPQTCITTPCAERLTEEDLAELIGRPPTEAEWEDYLVRHDVYCEGGTPNDDWQVDLATTSPIYQPAPSAQIFAATASYFTAPPTRTAARRTNPGQSQGEGQGQGQGNPGGSFDWDWPPSWNPQPLPFPPTRPGDPLPPEDPVLPAVPLPGAGWLLLSAVALTWRLRG